MKPTIDLLAEVIDNMSETLAYAVLSPKVEEELLNALFKLRLVHSRLTNPVVQQNVINIHNAHDVLVEAGYSHKSEVVHEIISKILYYCDTHKPLDEKAFGAFLAELEERMCK